MSEPLILRSASDFSLEAFQEVVWEERPLALHPDLLIHLATSRENVLDALAESGPVYGVTTGMGYLAHVQLSEEETALHQANLLLGRAVGGPPYLGREESRAVLLARLAGFLGGEAGVSAELCVFLAGRLNDGFAPAIPRTQIGCAGEIIPLAHAFQTFIGAGKVLSADGGVPASAGVRLEDAGAALAARGIPPYRPGPKEGVALLAGAPGALALTVARWRAARMLSRQLLLTFAAAIDALRAPLAPYDPVVALLANDELMETVLAGLGRLLRGSNPDRRATPAPVSFRVIPQVLTHLARTLARTEEDLRRGITAVTDSPVFLGPWAMGHGPTAQNSKLKTQNPKPEAQGPGPRFISTGNFHAIGFAAGMDQLCIALVQAAELAAQHIHRLLDSRFTGLPDQLTPAPGPRVGLVAVHKRVVGTVNELRRLAAPATIGLADTSMGQEDAMTFAFEAAEKLRRCQDLARDVIACELLVCRQAWALRLHAPGSDSSSAVASGLEEYFRAIAGAVPPIDEDRSLGEDIEKLVALLSAGELQA